MSLEISQKLFDQIFRQRAKKALVYLRKTKTKSDNYDKFRETGYNETQQNPLPVKILTKTIAPDSLIYRKMGLGKSGAIQGIIQNRDVNLIKNSDKITISGVEYYVWDDAVGNKLQIYPTQFANFSKVIIFRKDVGS